jgi:LysM repeat protein
MQKLSLLIFLTITFLVSNLQAQSVATVGGNEITATDVNYRIATEAAYGNTTVNRAMALISLVNDAIERKVAASVQADATAEEIAALSLHANTTTKAPAILAQIKNVFKSDVGSYNRVYLAPKVVNQKLREYCANSTELNAAEKSKIDAVQSLVQSGKTLEEAAADTALTVSDIEIPKTNEGSIIPNMPADPILVILEALEPGAIHPEIIEDMNGYRVVQLVEVLESSYKAQTITVNKKSYDEWFKGQAIQHRVQISDATLSEAIRTTYPNIWWVNQLMGD